MQVVDSLQKRQAETLNCTSVVFSREVGQGSHPPSTGKKVSLQAMQTSEVVWRDSQ
jgi:hypothetical protein